MDVQNKNEYVLNVNEKEYEFIVEALKQLFVFSYEDKYKSFMLKNMLIKMEENK